MIPPPDTIPPRIAPGGVVIRIYNAAGVLLLERRLTSLDGAEAAATIDANAVLERLRAAGEGTCTLAAYDGDTGARMVHAVHR